MADNGAARRCGEEGECELGALSLPEGRLPAAKPLLERGCAPLAGAAPLRTRCATAAGACGAVRLCIWAVLSTKASTELAVRFSRFTDIRARIRAAVRRTDFVRTRQILRSA